MRAVQHLLDLLTPSLCDGCGRRAAPPWCDACDALATALRPAVPCARCAGPDRPGHACWDGGSPIDATVALTAWRGPVARAVLHAKLAGRSEVLGALGCRLGSLVEAAAVEPPAAVVAVPSDPGRARRRGLDHTRVLARAVATTVGRPVVRALCVGKRVPDRGRAVAGQRTPMPTGAFTTTRAAGGLPSGVVLLVDDILTTGATLAAAARALRHAGAAAVHAAVVARAGSHHLSG